MQHNPESKNELDNPSIALQSIPHQPMVFKLNGDSSAKLKVYGMWITIILLILVIFFVRFALPQTYQTIQNSLIFKESNNPDCNPSGFSSDNQLLCRAFSGGNPTAGLMMHHITNLNQFCLFYIKTIKNSNSNSTMIINQDLVFQIHELTAVEEQRTKILSYQRTKTLYSSTFHFMPNYRNYMDVEVKKKSNSSKISFKYFFAYSRQVMRHSEDENFNVVALLKFTNITQIQPFDNIILQAQAINPKFTKFSITIRAVFAILSLITGFIYFRRYSQLPKYSRIVETKIVALASLLIFLFNDPFYVITILSPNPLSTFFSTLVVVAFLIFLLFLWVFFLQRIYYQQDFPTTTNLLKIRRLWPLFMLYFLILTFSMTLFCLYEYFTLNKIPMIIYADIQELKVVPIIVILAILIGIIIMYQIVLFILILKKYCFCRQQSEKLMFRNINYLIVYPFFLVIYVGFFIAGGAMTFSYEAVWILYGYSFMNLFVFILQYLYYAHVQQPPSQRDEKVFDQKLDVESNFQIRQKDTKRNNQQLNNEEVIKSINPEKN